LVDEIADEAPSALEDLEDEERAGMIRRVLLDLPEADRLLITLRYDEGLSYAQIGEFFGIPAATVGTHLFRAKRRLQTALSGLREGEG
jgi:RNA polymerase sigma-70 factor (ECF subfamily)